MPFFYNNGQRIHYRAKGRGEPLIFLHGMGFCGADWFAQEKHFSRSYRVVIPDFRGYGKSERSENPKHSYSVASHSEDFAALLQHLKIASAFVVGWSLGGMVALQAALDFPERIRRLAVINAVPSKPVQYPWDIILKTQRNLFLEFLGMGVYAQTAANFMFPFVEQRELRARVADKIATNSKVVYRRSIQAIFDWDLTHRLHELEIPILFISGDRDFITPALKRQIVDDMPNARLKVVHNSGHGTPLDQPDVTNRLLGEFLRAGGDVLG